MVLVVFLFILAVLAPAAVEMPLQQLAAAVEYQYDNQNGAERQADQSEIIVRLWVERGYELGRGVSLTSVFVIDVTARFHLITPWSR